MTTWRVTGTDSVGVCYLIRVEGPENQHYAIRLLPDGLAQLRGLGWDGVVDHPNWGVCPECDRAAGQIIASGGADFDYPKGPYCSLRHHCPICQPAEEGQQVTPSVLRGGG